MRATRASGIDYDGEKVADGGIDAADALVDDLYVPVVGGELGCVLNCLE